MYRIRDIFDLKINKTQASKEIGITREYLTNVLNGKCDCSKLVAYCITKYINPKAEINDIFYTIRED